MLNAAFTMENNRLHVQRSVKLRRHLAAPPTISASSPSVSLSTAKMSFNKPRIGGVRQNLAFQERFKASFLKQRGLLRVAKLAVGLIFDDELLVADWIGVPATNRIDLNLALIVNLLDDRLRLFATLGQ